MTPSPTDALAVGAADMEALRSCEGFHWDDGNADKNWVAHQVTQGECEEVFFNEPLVAARDIGHSSKESRYFALGQNDEGRRLLVVFTIRDALIRVISARDMSRREREVYEDAGRE